MVDISLALMFITVSNVSAFLYLLRDSGETSQEAVSGLPGRDLVKSRNV